MTIYRYLDDKDALLDGVVEQVWNEVSATFGPGVEWDSALRGYAEALRASLRAHPRAAPLLLTRPVMARASLVAFEALIELLREAGFDDQSAARLVRAVTMVVLSDVASTHGFHALNKMSATSDDTDTWITLARALPADTPTSLVRTAALICAPEEADADMAFMLDLVITGATGLQH
jgi:AcrR family transcriptional regulator